MTPEPPRADARRMRLGVAYDGTNFNGWARQPVLRTVQGALEEGIWTIFGRRGEPISLTVAGRTDAGVHATGQVAHVDLSAERFRALERPRGSRLPDAGAALLRRVNGALGQYSDVTLTSAEVAPAGFDARFSAIWRRYTYRVADPASFRNPLRRHDTAWHSRPLDAERMDAAAASLVGLHDFASYCRPREGATTIRTLLDYSWRRDVDGIVIAEVKADAFCHSMVRALVGGCVAVGDGRLDARDLVRLRDDLQRTSAFAVMPARGLTLVQVGYPEDDLLAMRAELTRARRSLEVQDGE